jgi:hypothetical protein
MDVGSKEPLQVIKFDHPEPPTKHGWDLIEGSEQDFMPYQRDPDHGRILQIKAEQDFCMDYHVGMLQQACKAIGFVVRSGSDFAFYAEVRVRSQEEVTPDSKLLYCHVMEGSYPEQHPEHSNEYEVHVPVDQLGNGWVLMKIDLSEKTREAAAVKDEEWEFDRLLMLRLKVSRGEVDVAYIELYKENPFEPYPDHEESSPTTEMATLEEDAEQVPSEYPNRRQTSQLKIDLFESGRHDLHDREDTLRDIIKIAKLFGIWYDEWKLFVSQHDFYEYQYLYEDHYSKELISFLDNLDRIGRQTSYEVRLLNSINALEWYPDVDSIIETIEFVISYAEENWVWISEQWARFDLDKRQQEIPNFGAIEFLKDRYQVFLKTIRGLRLHANRLRTSEAYLLLHPCKGADVSTEDGLGRQAIPQLSPRTERPASAISVSLAIRKLATLIRALHEAGEQPCTLLLGSSLSLTPEVRRAVCESDDWEAFWTEMQQLSATERRALMVGPLAELNLAPGYRCLAELAKAGYFDIILTANVDDALDNALRILPASECKILCHGQTSAQEITAALSRRAPRVKAIKLRGDINAYKLPLTPEGQFEFPKELEEAVERLLSQDTIVVGDISHDTDIQRCIRQGEGGLWVVVPEEPRPGGFLYNAKRARPAGEVITGPEAEFVPLFSALAHELGMEGPRTSIPSPEGRKLIKFTFTPPDPNDNLDWFSAFRKITKDCHANGFWTDNNDAKNKFIHLEDFVEPFCEGQVYGALFALYSYSKDSDGNFDEHVQVILKIKPKRELSFEVTDRTQAHKREELAKRILQGIGRLKGVELISTETL